MLPGSSQKGVPLSWLAVGAFGLLILAGLVLRGLAAVNAVGIVHPDEHQQYLEQAQGLAFGGPTQQFWEQKQGLRGLFYPSLLAGLLLVVDHLGIHDPFLQAAALRGILATIILLLFAWLAGRDLRRGQPVRAWALILLATLTTGVIYVNVRLLSENAMMIPLLLGLLCLERRPALAGVWFGIMQAIRFQSAFLVLGFLLLALLDDIRSGQFTRAALWQSRTLRMGVAFLVTVTLAVGLVDYLTFGAWFHSPVAYFQANVIEGRARDWGVAPWFYYFPWIGAGLLLTSVFAPFWLLAGAFKEWRLAFVAALMLVGHSLTEHKEFRFLWGALPLVLILLASGVAAIWNWLRPGRVRLALIAGFAVSVAVGSVVTVPNLRWQNEPYRSSALALAAVGQQPDATGVAVCGPAAWDCGNYFYLRRDVPLVYCRPNDLPAEPSFARGDVNYLVLPREKLAIFDRWQPEVIADCGDLVACKLQRPIAGPVTDATGSIPKRD